MAMTDKERADTVAWLRAQAVKLDALYLQKGRVIFATRASALREMAERLVERVKEVEQVKRVQEV
jgi:hypothetical protein